MSSVVRRRALTLVVSLLLSASPALAQEQETPADQTPSEVPSEPANDTTDIEPLGVEPVPDPPAPGPVGEIEEARLLFHAGREAFEAGRFENALDYFQRSRALTGDPELLYNIAVTADRLRQDRLALEAFETYLAENPRTPDRYDIERRIRILRDSVERATVVPDDHDMLELDPDPDPTPASPPSDEGSVLETWWFWTILGVAVAAGVTTTILLATENPDPIAGDEGVVLMGLTRW